MSFFTTNNNTAVVISNLAPPAWNSITRFDDKLSFMINIFFVFFCCLLLYCCIYFKNQTWPSVQRLYHFLNEETWNEIDTCWLRDKIQDGGEYLHDLFSSKSFHTCAKKLQDKWVDRTFPKSKGKFFVEIILSSKYLWKRNKFSIVIVSMWDSKWMTFPELL